MAETLPPVRRIVTGINEAGRSTVILDGDAPNRIPAQISPNLIGRLMWRTTAVPASNEGNEDEAPDGLRVPTQPEVSGGTLFRITDFPPDSDYGDVSQLGMTELGAKVSEERRQKHFMFHRTDTVDYAICLKGEIWALLDDAEVHMREGDVLIQRGTEHAWANRSNETCRMAFIVVDAVPVDHA